MARGIGCFATDRLWPPPASIMGEDRKNAYRLLLYEALLQIRALCQSRGGRQWNPVKIHRQYVRSVDAGAIADWLHNLGQFAANDFVDFSEVAFWRAYYSYARSYHRIARYDYRDSFDRQLARLEKPLDGLAFTVGRVLSVEDQGLALIPANWGTASVWKDAEIEIRLGDGSSLKSTVLRTIFEPTPAIIITPGGYSAESFIDAKIYALTRLPSG